MLRLFGFVFVVLGLVTYFRPDMFEAILRFRNEIKGVKSEFTSNTRSFYKFVSLLWIGIGILLAMGIV